LVEVGQEMGILSPWKIREVRVFILGNGFSHLCATLAC